jgi:hypothetical protein
MYKIFSNLEHSLQDHDQINRLWRGGDVEGEGTESGGQETNKKVCRDPGSNGGPLDLQSNAIPTELSRLYLLTKCFLFFLLVL